MLRQCFSGMGEFDILIRPLHQGAGGSTGIGNAVLRFYLKSA
jgi:hypothetical protein